MVCKYCTECEKTCNQKTCFVTKHVFCDIVQNVILNKNCKNVLLKNVLLKKCFVKKCFVHI